MREASVMSGNCAESARRSNLEQSLSSGCYIVLGEKYAYD